MSRESTYWDVKSPLNLGISYQFNDYLNLSSQYLHGSQISVTAHVTVNPNRPPLLGGKELAPVPMRLRAAATLPTQQTDIDAIKKVLAADKFEISGLKIENESINIIIINTKFRSTAQAVGRLQAHYNASRQTT